MASFESARQDLTQRRTPQPADTDSEWVLVDTQTEGGESTDSSSTPAYVGSSAPARSTASPPQKIDRCGGLKDIEDSETATSKDKKCSHCHDCESKSPRENHSTSIGTASNDEDALPNFEAKPGECVECAFSTEAEDPITHIQRLTDILKFINRSLAAELDKEVAGWKWEESSGATAGDLITDG